MNHKLLTPAFRAFIWSVIFIIITLLVVRKMTTPSDQATQQDDPKSKSKKVQTQKIKIEDQTVQIDLTGNVQSDQKIDLYAEVSGTLTGARFKEGNRFKKGALILSLENQEDQLNYQAKKSDFIALLASVMGDIATDYPSEKETWQNFLQKVTSEKRLGALPSSLQTKFTVFLSTKKILSTYYSLKAMEERLRKSNIYAPFAGTLAQANVRSGTQIRPGQFLGVFAGDSHFELWANFSKIHFKYLIKGTKIQMCTLDSTACFSGTLVRLNSTVDSQSQMVKAYFKLQGKQLKEGQFLKGKLRAGTIHNACKIPIEALEDNKVYVVSGDSIVNLQEVKVLHRTEKEAVCRGLNEESVLILNPSGLRVGEKVRF